MPFPIFLRRRRVPFLQIFWCIGLLGLAGGLSLRAQPIQKRRVMVNGISVRYSVRIPDSLVKGLVLLLPGSGQPASQVWDASPLAASLVAHHYAVVVPELRQGLVVDTANLVRVAAVLRDQASAAPPGRVVIGGLSSGGALAVRYAEYCLAAGDMGALKGLVVIDAPLDLERLFYSAAQKSAYPCAGVVAQEGLKGQKEILRKLGGEPSAQLSRYRQESGYSASAGDGGNARLLVKLPTRLYSEPDLDFVRKTYCADLQATDINATDMEGMYQVLLKAGNTDADYIATQGRGFHTWNIVEPERFVRWLDRIITR